MSHLSYQVTSTIKMKSTGHSYRSLKMKSTYAEVGRALVTLERVDDAEVGLQVQQFLQVGVGVKQLGGLGCRVQLGHQANCHDKHRHEES